MNQEVGFVSAVGGAMNYSDFPLGSLLFLLPYHVSQPQYACFCCFLILFKPATLCIIFTRHVTRATHHI